MLKQWMLGFCSFFFITTVFAAYTEGVDYIKLPASVKQQAVVQTFLDQDKGKIQVAEFFSYKCPGCFTVEGPFSNWAASAPKDVAVRRVPVSFGPTWEPLAKTYYALEELNVIERLSPIIFNGVHKERLPLETQDQIATFLAKHDVSLNDFNAAYEGFNVNRRWAQAQSLTSAEQVTSIPAVVVNGEYLTHIGLTKDPEKLIKVIDYLIELSKK